jgi:hypothetical protein
MPDSSQKNEGYTKITNKERPMQNLYQTVQVENKRQNNKNKE